jgi:hypothetical protein
VVDSDEENLMKVRHASQKKDLMKTYDQSRKMREEELAEMFEQQLSEFYSSKSAKIREEEKQKR